MKRQLATWLLRKGAGDGVGMLPDFLYKMGSQFLIDKRFPTHIYLELSRSCNYQCKMCVRKKSDHGYMPLSLVEKVVNEAKKFGPTSFSLHLYGEPLLSPNYEKAIKIIKQANKHNVVLLTTNGSLLTTDVALKLIDSQVDIIYLSMPSLNYFEYYNMTGNDLSKVMINASDFMKIRDVNKKPLLIVRTYSERFFYVPMCDKVVLRKYHNFGGDNNSYSHYTTQNRYPCYHPWFTLAVNYNGEVSVCCSDYHNELFVGSLYRETLEEIWKGESISTFRAMHKGKWKMHIKCEKCDVWNVKPDLFFNWQKGKYD